MLQGTRDPFDTTSWDMPIPMILIASHNQKKNAIRIAIFITFIVYHETLVLSIFNEINGCNNHYRFP